MNDRHGFQLQLGILPGSARPLPPNASKALDANANRLTCDTVLAAASLCGTALAAGRIGPARSREVRACHDGLTSSL